jgi:hypothetical protein
VTPERIGVRRGLEQDRAQLVGIGGLVGVVTPSPFPPFDGFSEIGASHRPDHRFGREGCWWFEPACTVGRLT